MEENQDKKSDNNLKKKNPLSKNPLNPKPGGERPSYQVWVIVSLLTVIFGIMWFGRQGSVKPINKKDFEEIYLRHDVEKIMVVNGKVVEITVKPKALENSYYKKSI